VDQFFDMFTLANPVATTTPVATMLLSLLMACAIGQVMGWVYLWTHVSPSYSKSFTASLVTLPVIVCLMMILMAGSTAIAFGLLAVFAVVRFRNVLKDTRDTSFVLWAIVEGMGVGTMHYTESICGLVVVGGLMGYLWLSDFGSRQQFDATLAIDMGQTSVPPDEMLSPILDRHAAKWKKSGNQQLTQIGSSIAYQLLLRDPSRSDELRDELLQTDDVQQISLFVNDFQSET
jgi:hypothetical protein